LFSVFIHNVTQTAFAIGDLKQSRRTTDVGHREGHLLLDDEVFGFAKKRRKKALFPDNSVMALNPIDINIPRSKLEKV